MIICGLIFLTYPVVSNKKYLTTPSALHNLDFIVIKSLHNVNSRQLCNKNNFAQPPWLSGKAMKNEKINEIQKDPGIPSRSNVLCTK
jgi:hypothetical protein